MPTTSRDPKSSLKPSTGEERRCQVSTRGPGMSGELRLWGMALFFSGASGRESHHLAGASAPALRKAYTKLFLGDADGLSLIAF